MSDDAEKSDIAERFNAYLKKAYKPPDGTPCGCRLYTPAAGFVDGRDGVELGIKCVWCGRVLWRPGDPEPDYS